jgi:hypothetical protein
VRRLIVAMLNEFLQIHIGKFEEKHLMRKSTSREKEEKK